MLYAKPTPKGSGVEFWGDYNDLRSLYEIIQELSSFISPDNDAIARNEQLLSIILQDIRHAYQGKQLIDPRVDNGGCYTTYYGFATDWITILFTLSALRYNASLKPTDEILQSNLLQLEYWTEKAAYQYDPKGARDIAYFIRRRINVSTQYVFLLYQYLINQFFSNKTGKRRFRSIPELLSYTFNGPELEKLTMQWDEAAKRNNCEINELEYDSGVDYIIT